MQEIIKYKGQEYSLEKLLDQPEESLSNRQRMALRSYKKNAGKSQVCHGFFGVPCQSEPRVSGYCSSCYRKKIHFNGINSFLSEVYGIKNMDVSSSNLLIYKPLLY